MQTNNFQAIVVTNISHTYCIFNYICGEMEWSGFGEDIAVVGYIASNTLFTNNPSSGFPSINDSVSCLAMMRSKRRKRQQPVNMNSQQSFPTTDDTSMQAQLMDVCITEKNLNNQITLGLTDSSGNPTSPPELATQLLPCPPSAQKASMDSARFEIQPNIDPQRCYITTNPLIAKSLLAGNLTVTQQCCYSSTGYVHNL